MITLFGQSYAWNSPEVLLVGGLLVLLVGLLLLTLRSAGRSAKSAEPLLREMSWMSQRVQSLSEGQERLAGGLHHVSENQAVSQTAMLKVMEQRLELWAKVFEASSEGIIIMNAEQQIISVNKAFCRSTHYDFYELIGDDTGVFGCMSLLGCHDVCPKGLSLQTQIAFLRRKMAVTGLK